ncbi:MAG: recombinase XerC, partial [Alphaproteobacteria bacterium]|nr:recombinase XerC [Alphaproteobacteria bacterium]
MTGAEMVEAWNRFLAQDRRRSVHTVRAYGAAAARLIEG